jgi:hypothetical protein
MFPGPGAIEIVGHGFGLAAELLLGAACHKSYPNHVDVPANLRLATLVYL